MGSIAFCSTDANKQLNIGQFVQFKNPSPKQSNIYYMVTERRSSELYRISPLVYPIRECEDIDALHEYFDVETKQLKLITNKQLLAKCREDWQIQKQKKSELWKQERAKEKEHQIKTLNALKIRNKKREKDRELVYNFMNKHCNTFNRGSFVKFKDERINIVREAPQFLYNFEYELFDIHLSNSKYSQWSLFSTLGDIHGGKYNYQYLLHKNRFKSLNSLYYVFDKFELYNEFDYDISKVYKDINTFNEYIKRCGNDGRDNLFCFGSLNWTEMNSYKQVMGTIFMIPLMDENGEMFCVYSWDLQLVQNIPYQKAEIFRHKYAAFEYNDRKEKESEIEKEKVNFNTQITVNKSNNNHYNNYKSKSKGIANNHKVGYENNRFLIDQEKSARSLQRMKNEHERVFKQADDRYRNQMIEHNNFYKKW